MTDQCFVNPTWLLPLLCKISEAIHPAQPCLMASCKVGKQNEGNFKNFIGFGFKYLIFTAFNKDIELLQQV